MLNNHMPIDVRKEKACAKTRRWLPWSVLSLPCTERGQMEPPNINCGKCRARYGVGLNDPSTVEMCCQPRTLELVARAEEP